MEAKENSYKRPNRVLAGNVDAPLTEEQKQALEARRKEALKEYRKQEKDEKEKAEIEARRAAALKQMRYLISQCENYSDIYKKAVNHTKPLQNQNVFVPTIDDIRDAKKFARMKGNKVDYNIKDMLKYFQGGTLHPYQIEGVKWMYNLYLNSSNGILADEMGLGKTIQVIALICVLLFNKVKGPFLIVVPLSTIPNWQSEFKRFAPQIPVIAITGVSEVRHANMGLISKLHKVGPIETLPVVLGTYQLLSVEFKALLRQRWRYIIVDEAQRIKNHESQLSIALRKLRSENRILLTGTPLQNNLTELWSMLNFIVPNFFVEMETFTELLTREDFEDEEKLIQEEESNNIVSKLQTVLKPFMLRRMKKDVLIEMVPKKEVTVFCPMTDIQIKLYDFVIERNLSALLQKPDEETWNLDEPRPKRKCTRNNDFTYFDNITDKKFLKLVDSGNLDLFIKTANATSIAKEIPKDVIIRLTMAAPMMMFRKIINHPYLVNFPLDPNSPTKQLLVNEELVTSSGKMMVLDAILPELKKRGHKVLLFSQFTMLLDLLEDYLLMRNHNYRRLDGSQDIDIRTESIHDFNNNPDIFIFLISTKAGGVGLNLMGADTVIFYDRFWNPQVDLQAQDRCHRIGQTKPVVVYTLTAKNTVDDHILSTAEPKRLLEKVIIAEGKFKSTNNEDRAKTEDILIELRKALQKPKEDSYVFSNKIELNRLLDRSDLYKQMEGMAREMRRLKRL
ncbi:lymphoid-specific helicase-like [Euwallacea fornicatus]|uniref:lymphoid-specific helicase-like n=1 Tax=Euwallacea fornicatus TaxID=995702 RepID=UPI00338FED22